MFIILREVTMSNLERTTTTRHSRERKFYSISSPLSLVLANAFWCRYKIIQIINYPGFET